MTFKEHQEEYSKFMEISPDKITFFMDWFDRRRVDAYREGNLKKAEQILQIEALIGQAFSN